MKLHKPAAAFVLCALTLLAARVSPAQTPTLAIAHVAVIDGTGRAPQEDQTVLIVGDRIAKVGPAKSIQVPKSARVVDGSGKFLLPGLWDMHVHVAGINADPKWSGDALLPVLIASGITGVRDMGGDLEALNTWKREIAAGQRIGPHILASGPFLLGRGKKTADQIPVANADEARATVRDLKQRGADFIKIITMPSPEAFFDVADECKKQNIPFVGHLPRGVSALEASNAGMHSIEHLFYSSFALSVSSKEAELRDLINRAVQTRDAALASKAIDEANATYDPQKAAALWSAFKKNGTWVEPTLAAIYRVGHPLPAARLHSDYLPAAVNQSWAEDAKDSNRESAAAGIAKQAENDWKLTREMHAAGVSILVGSDSLDPGMIPGASLYSEMAELIKAGMGPMDVIVAATRDAARFAGLDKDYGTIEPSKYADLALFRSDPTHNLAESLSSLDAVVLHGRYHDRPALNSMLDQARKAAAGVK